MAIFSRRGWKQSLFAHSCLALFAVNIEDGRLMIEDMSFIAAFENLPSRTCLREPQADQADQAGQPE